MKLKILAAFAASLVAGVTISASTTVSSDVEERLMAGDYCGLIEEHVCELCDDEQLAPAVVYETCPGCGSNTFSEVCSGVRVMNPNPGYQESANYHYVECEILTHDDGCKIVQSRFYTDKTCKNSSCNYRESGGEWHIESYYHTLNSAADNRYCQLRKDFRSTRSATSAAVDAVADDCHVRNPIEAGDICEHSVPMCDDCKSLPNFGS